MPLPLAAGECLVDGQQNDGTQQGYQQGRDGDGVIDRSDTQQGADKVTSQERPNHADYDIQQKALLRIRPHDPAGDITDECSGNEIYNDVQLFFSF
jgi:hypothetical protein